MSNVERLHIPTDAEALLNRRSSVAQRASRCLRDGAGLLELLPGTLREAIEIEAWAERQSPNGAIWRLSSFREWVTTDIPVGLGTTYEKLCDLLSREPEVLAAVRRAWGTELAPNGGERPGAGRLPAEPTAHNQSCNTKLIKEAAAGGTADYTRARLARDADPVKSKLPPEQQERARELVQQVDAGVIRPNKAAVEMGYRKTPSPLNAVKNAWAKADQAQREEIAAWVDQQVSALRGSRFQ